MGESEISDQTHRLVVDESADEVVEIGGPQIIHPVLVEPQPSSHIQSTITTKSRPHSTASVKHEGEWTKVPITPHMLAGNHVSIVFIWCT